jgi:hypothetical protein
MSTITHPEKKRGIVSLNSCIRGAMVDIGADMHRYEQFKKWAIQAYRDFRFDISQEVKTVQMSLTAWKAIDLDLIPDYIDWAIIGLRVNGEILAFENNEDLSLYFDDENTDGFPDIQPTDNNYVYDPTDPQTRNGYWFWNSNSKGEDSGGIFGLAIKDNGRGYFRVNKERNEIQFNPRIASTTKIYMEYICDGFDPGVKTMVNIYAAKCIELYIIGKD